MSMDGVDDLHAAEDMAGALAGALEELLRLTRGTEADAALTAHFDETTLDLYRRARKVGLTELEAWTSYCRPTCQAHGDPAACEDDDPSCCGCPCDHGEPAEGEPVHPSGAVGV